MVQQVKVDGVIHQFPDEATPSMIAEALGVQPPDEAPARPAMDKDRLAYALGTNRTPVDTIRDLASGILTGMGKGGQFLGEQMEKIPGFDKLQQKVQSATGISVPRVNMDEMFSGIASPNKSIGGNITKGVGEYAPYALAGGASLPGQIAAGLASGAAMTEPDEKNLMGWLPQGKVGGALESAIMNLLTHGAFKGLEALRPSQMFRGEATPEQLQRNVDVTKGTETGLGDVIESPFLKKRLENTLTMTPFSGANESLQRTGKEVVKRGEDLLQKFLGDNSPENVPSQIADVLQDQFKTHQASKAALYKTANKIADDMGLQLELPNFANKAKDVTEAIDQTNILKSEPDIAKIYSKLQNYKNPAKQTKIVGAIVDENGQPILNHTDTTYPTLQEANILKGKLNEYANMASKSTSIAERNSAAVFGQLANSLKKDINIAIKKSGNPDLRDAYREAEDNYAKKFSPFLDRDIYKFTSGNADPETIIQKFIKTSPNQDLANQLSKLSDKLPPQSRDLLTYSYLSRALDNQGNLNPNMLGTAIKKLGTNQLRKLVPDPAMRKELLDYSKLTKMNQESQNLMFNPNTGQRNRDAIITGLLGYLGHAATGNIGALAVPTAAIMGGRGLTKALTSQGFREKLVNEMIKNKPKFNTPAKKLGTEAALQGIMNSNSNSSGS